MKFLIIGADAAGMSAASRAGRNLPGIEITVLEKTRDVSYSACGMPYNIADPNRDIDDLVVRDARTFREKQGIRLLTGHEAASIDPEARRVFGKDSSGRAFEEPYDKLLIATGASSVMPDMEGADLPGVMALKSLGDGRKIKAWLRERNVRKVVIMGMGYIALEMCEALRSRAIEVEMAKPGPVFLPGMAPELSEAIRKETESHGATLRMGREMERIEPAGNSLKIICKDSPDMEADMVLAAMGVKPNSALALSAGLKTDVAGAIAVDRSMRTSDPHIYAAGDCADAYHVVTGKKTWIPLALRANRAGWAVADHLAGKDVRLPGVSGAAVFKVFDFQAAQAGISEKKARREGFDPASVTVKTRSRAHAHPGASEIWIHMVGDRKTGRLLGAQMAGREGCAHRINTVSAALSARMTVEDFFQTDFAYAPPFGPVWDPLLTAANQLIKKM
jgi:CoA-dependent NAD(P)H sulfur oxidoreductase